MWVILFTSFFLQKLNFFQNIKPEISRFFRDFRVKIIENQRRKLKYALSAKLQIYSTFLLSQHSVRWLEVTKW